MIGQKLPKLTKTQEQAAYKAVNKRDGERCVKCGSHEGVQRDHRRGRDAYNTVPSNLQCLCRECHASKHADTLTAAQEGFACPRWADPAFWPARRHDTTSWVLYLDKPDIEGKWWVEISETVAEMLMRGNPTQEEREEVNDVVQGDELGV